MMIFISFIRLFIVARAAIAPPDTTLRYCKMLNNIMPNNRFDNPALNNWMERAMPLLTNIKMCQIETEHTGTIRNEGWVAKKKIRKRLNHYHCWALNEVPRNGSLAYEIWSRKKKTSQEMNKLSRRFVNRIAFFFFLSDWMQIISLELNNFHWYKVVISRYILDAGHHLWASEKSIIKFYSSILMLLQHYPVWF